MAIWVSKTVQIAGADSWEQRMEQLAEECGWRVRYSSQAGIFTFVRVGRQTLKVGEGVLIDAALKGGLTQLLDRLRLYLTSR